MWNKAASFVRQHSSGSQRRWMVPNGKDEEKKDHRHRHGHGHGLKDGEEYHPSTTTSTSTHPQFYGVKFEDIADDERTNVDVLCGTGTGPNQWPGNIDYRRMVEERRAEYLAATHKAKRPIAMQVVQLVRTVRPMSMSIVEFIHVLSFCMYMYEIGHV